MRFEELDLNKINLTEETLQLQAKYGLSLKAALLMDRMFLAGMLYSTGLVLLPNEPEKNIRKQCSEFEEELAQYLSELEAQIADARSQ